MELINYLSISGSVGMYIYNYRGRIYDRLVKTRAGKLIMAPIILPYLIYGLYKLAKDPFMIKLLNKINSQTKITDFL